MAGCVSASRSARALGSENTISRSFGRSRCPSGVSIARPKRSTSCSSGGWPGSTTSRATWSVSMMGTPRAAKNFATVDFPLAMPPVSPTRKTLVLAIISVRRKQTEITRHQLLSEHQHQPPRGGKKRPEGDGGRAILSPGGQQRDAYDGTDRRGNQHGRQQHPPAEPRAERRQELEITVPHSFLGGEQTEEMIDGPEAEVTCNCSDDAGAHVYRDGGHAREWREEAQEEAQPQKGKRQAVGQQLMIDVDERERHQEPGEDQPGGRRPAEAELPRHGRAEDPGQGLDDGIPDADVSAAIGAAATQKDVAHDRDVLQRRDGCLAGGAGGAGDHEVEALLERRGRRKGGGEIRLVELRALLAPLALHHDGQ